MSQPAKKPIREPKQKPLSKTPLVLMREQMHLLIDQFFDRWESKLTQSAQRKAASAAAEPASLQAPPQIQKDSVTFPQPSVIDTTDAPAEPLDPKLEAFFQWMRQAPSQSPCRKGI